MKSLTKFSLFLLIITGFFDMFTTLLVRFKHPYFNESNPIYIITGSLFIFYIIKILVIGLIVLYFCKYYFKPPIYVRYLIVVYLILITLNQGVAGFGNLEVYNQDPTEIKPLSEELLLEHYEESYGQTTSMPIIIYLFQLMLFFIVWHKIEKEQKHSCPH